MVVDLFAGGGGASLGMKRAYREPDIAVNHDVTATGVHKENHPFAQHYTCDVFEIDPLVATGGRPVDVLWASPDCRHHSKAKGGAPRSAKIRGLASVVVDWIAACRPAIVHLENVEEFADWGPLLASGQPCKRRKGLMFRRWVRDIEKHGYRVEYRELVAADYGAPTIRKRLYVIARRDNQPVYWPAPTHHRFGAGGLPVWRYAAECIDFDRPSQSIFDRSRPLVDNTLRRVAKGVWKHLLATSTPFIAPLRGTSASHTSTHAITDPLSTVSGGGTHHALVQPQFTPLGPDVANMARAYWMQGGSIDGGDREEGSVVTAAFMDQANGGFYAGDGRPLTAPVSTICSSGANQRLVTASLIKYYRDGGQWQALHEPMHTVPTKSRMGLVEVVQLPAAALPQDVREKAAKVAALLHRWLPEHFPERVDMVVLNGFVLSDIMLRMLVPRELARAQGFPEDYQLEFTAAGKPVSITDQVRLIGNSVCPGVAEAIIAANVPHLGDVISTAAA